MYTSSSFVCGPLPHLHSPEVDDQEKRPISEIKWKKALSARTQVTLLLMLQGHLGHGKDISISLANTTNYAKSEFVFTLILGKIKYEFNTKLNLHLAS